MSSFRAIFEEALQTLGVIDGSVLIGVSGGADSVALLRAFAERQSSFRFRLTAAHLNHRLRGADADADAEWVERLCQTLSVPSVIGAIDVDHLARESGRGIEEAARDSRYAFFKEAARQVDCQFVAVAHTADDQAETVLHHVLRGTGLAGLSGMPAVRELDRGVKLVRPLLGIRHEMLRDYLRELGQAYREDSSNADESFTRNRLRLGLIPHLEREYNPQVVDALCRLGQHAVDVQGALAACAADLLERAIESIGPCECRLKWQHLSGRPRHLVREVLTQLWRRQGWPRQRMDFDHWDRLARMVIEGGSGDFPQGLSAARSGRLFTILWGRSRSGLT